MTQLTPEIVSEIVETCRAGADEAAAALARVLDIAEPRLSVGETADVQLPSLLKGLDTAGLVVVLTLEDAAVAVLIHQQDGLIPGWCQTPDATGQSKLKTLAQELGMTLLGENLLPTEFTAAWAEPLAGVIERGEPADGAVMLPLELSGEETVCKLTMIWPLAKPSAVLCPADLEETKSQAAVEPKSNDEGQEQKEADRVRDAADASRPDDVQVRTPTNSAQRPADLQELPSYSRSLLKIKVPVVVTLAEKRQSLGNIIELGPGSIIHFEKSCEEMLNLNVGEHRVATGEAVKVGDKFGLRITSMLLPEERFEPVTAAGIEQR